MEQDEEDDEGEMAREHPLREKVQSRGWWYLSLYPSRNINQKMTNNIFKNLRDCYQILENVPIYPPRKLERCYSRRTVNIGMYDAIFTTGLRLPLTELHHQLANYLGLSVSQIAPNAWRISIGAEVI